MANIFGNEPALPDWMRGLGAENRKVAGQFGETLGTSLAAGLMVASGENGDPDPMTGQAQPLSFGAAYQRARMNQVDPMWGLKAQQMKINAQDATFKMQAQSLALQDASEEREARLKDLPTVREWMKQSDTEAKWKQLPDVGSQWARGTVDSQVKMHDAKELKEQQLENQHLKIQNDLDAATNREETRKTVAGIQAKSREAVAQAQSEGRLAVAKAQSDTQQQAWKHREDMLHYSKLEASVHAKAVELIEKQKELTGQIKGITADSNNPATEKAEAIEKLNQERAAAAAQYDALVSGANAAPTAKPPTDPRYSDLPPAPILTDRKVGAIYNTPKGAFRWTGKGWEPAT